MSEPQQIQQIAIHEFNSQAPVLHPCQYGNHRWAWLNAGGQACGICGVPR